MAPNTNMPISRGMFPAGNLSYQISFITKYTKAIKILINAAIPPNMVAIRSPAFVYDVMLSMAAS